MLISDVVFAIGGLAILHARIDKWYEEVRFAIV
jgi:hypothetical protein